MNSLADSTMRQYESSLKQWWMFTKANNYDVFQTDKFKIIEFLTKRFREGAEYGTLNSDRAAITLITSENFSRDVIIGRFMRGVFRQRPTKAKYATTWDIDPVLDYIENLPSGDAANLKELSEKTILLLLLTTAHRLQTMALIDIRNIKETKTGIEIKIPKLIKTSKPGKCQPNLILPFFEERKDICAARAVLEYIKRTKNIRGDHSDLFISTVKPHKPVTAQTLSHWVKSILKKAGVDTSTFSAYSTKHATVSRAISKGVSIDTIKRVAGWSEKSKTFAQFYNRPIENRNETFALSVLSS